MRSDMLFGITEEAFSSFLLQANRRTLAETIRFFFEADDQTVEELRAWAGKARDKMYGKRVFFRALIEFSSWCKNDCYYCGLQRSNQNAVRYRLSDDEIISCCRTAYERGIRTFVLQSGEDPYYSDFRLCRLITEIKEQFPDSAVTLSVGERSPDSYQRLFDAGADRYLLRHESANEDHYRKLHPPTQRLCDRKRCLFHLKEIGYEVGTGFMVDSPDQTNETLADDFIFLRELKPDMIGIGPFIPHHDTRFAGYEFPSAKRTLILLSLIRVMLPGVLLPATTALAAADDRGFEKGLMAGANVLMPNASPLKRRDAYALYDHKPNEGKGTIEQWHQWVHWVESLGLQPDFSRGDSKMKQMDGER